MQEMTKLQDKIDSLQIWDIDSKVDMAMEALRCPDDSAWFPGYQVVKLEELLYANYLEEPDLLLLMNLPII